MINTLLYSENDWVTPVHTNTDFLRSFYDTYLQQSKLNKPKNEISTVWNSVLFPCTVLAILSDVGRVN